MINVLGSSEFLINLFIKKKNREFLIYLPVCCQGTSSTVEYDQSRASMLSNTNILVVEGYLFELPDTIKTIRKACEEARRGGALVAITASDISCIEKHYDDFWYTRCTLSISFHLYISF